MTIVSLRHQLIDKQAVAARLKVTERTLERLVKSGRFPKPLLIGKHAQWSESVVERWLEAALESQVTWTAPSRSRRGR